MAPSSVRRHEASHLSTRLVRARDAENLASAGDLLAELRALGISALEDVAVAATLLGETLQEATSLDDQARDRKRALALKALEVKGRAEERVARIVALQARVRGEFDARRREHEPEEIRQLTIKYEGDWWREFVSEAARDPETFAAARRIETVMARLGDPEEVAEAR